MIIPVAGRSRRALPRLQRLALPLEGHRSGRSLGQAAQADRRRDAEAGLQADGGSAGAPLRAGSLVGAADLPGDGRRRQGRHDQARDDRRQSAGLRSPLVQGARRPRSSITISCGAPIARLPRRGHIGIFNRSYYEETLVVRVHQNILARQQLPRELVTKNIWRERFEDINAFERYLSRQGVLVRKFFLHVSKEEQRKRFLERLEKPEKHWKFSPADVGEREHFAEYMAAYEDMIRHTATEWAPWHVVPADRKWFTRLVVSAVDHRRHRVARSALPRGRSEDRAPSSSGSRRRSRPRRSDAPAPPQEMKRRRAKK